MTDKIVTAKLADLIMIFDPAAQEQDDVGDARVLYTFDNNDAPQRNRVGDTFILQVLSPSLTFFVSAPVVDNIVEGSIILSSGIDGVPNTSSLADVDDFVASINIALGVGDDVDVSNLIDQ